jgi:hypothetical protein
VRFNGSYGGNLRPNRMSAWLIILTGAIYAYIAGEQLFKDNPHMAIVYAGYAFSNIGLYLLAK